MSVFALDTDQATGVATLLLDTGQPGNAIASEQLQPATAQLMEIAASPPPALVLRGQADFCAGRLPPAAGAALLAPEAQVRRTVGFFAAFASIDCPKVSFVTGSALGAGANLALQADLVVADAASQFGFPEIRAGFAPLLAMNTLLRTVQSRTALWLALTAETIVAERALMLGLVSEIGTCETALHRAAWLAEHRAEWNALTAFANEHGMKSAPERGPISVEWMIAELERSRGL